MNLVTLEQAREQLRSDSSDDDDYLKVKISAASSAVLEYITASIWEPQRDNEGRPLIGPEGKEIPLVDEGGKKVVRLLVQQATLLTIGYFYRERDGSQEFRVADQSGYGYALPQAATSLLYSMRKPTVV